MKPDYRDADFTAYQTIKIKEAIKVAKDLPRIKKDDALEESRWQFNVRKKPILQRALVLKEDTIVETSEGNMIGHAGDYLMEDVEGNFYPCKASVFGSTYDIIEPYGGDTEHG